MLTGRWTNSSIRFGTMGGSLTCYENWSFPAEKMRHAGRDISNSSQVVVRRCLMSAFTHCRHRPVIKGANRIP